MVGGRGCGVTCVQLIFKSTYGPYGRGRFSSQLGAGFVMFSNYLKAKESFPFFLEEENQSKDSLDKIHQDLEVSLGEEDKVVQTTLASRLPSELHPLLTSKKPQISSL